MKYKNISIIIKTNNSLIFLVLSYSLFDYLFYYHHGTENFKYGGIGLIISQQYAKAFIYKTNPNLGWDESSISKFTQKKNCFIDQINKINDNKAIKVNM